MAKMFHETWGPIQIHRLRDGWIFFLFKWGFSMTKGRWLFDKPSGRFRWRVQIGDWHFMYLSLRNYPFKFMHSFLLALVVGFLLGGVIW